MRLTLSAYVTVEREEGRSIYNCRPLRGPQIVTRDPLLSIALSKLGNKMRKSVNAWIEGGESARLGTWLYDSETRGVPVKLTLAARSHATLETTAGVHSASHAHDRLFAIDSRCGIRARAVGRLELRAEVDSARAQEKISDGAEFILDEIGGGSEMWVEPLEVEVETKIRDKKNPRISLQPCLAESRAVAMKNCIKWDNAWTIWHPTINRHSAAANW
ncbi:MAG: hypothetical protein R3C56_11790 [Pirellulaceae bacterium]